MKVFLTGGTGFVGQQVLARLIASGHKVRVLVRRPDSEFVRALVKRYGVEIHEGDVTDPESLRGAPGGMDAVIHLVGIISEVGKATFENVHTEGTRNMVEAAQRHGVKRFIHMSALGTRPNADSRYHR